MTKKYTLKEINYHIKDESHAVKDYRKKGLTTFANDENKHLKYCGRFAKNTNDGAGAGS